MVFVFAFTHYVYKIFEFGLKLAEHGTLLRFAVAVHKHPDEEMLQTGREPAHRFVPSDGQSDAVPPRQRAFAGLVLGRVWTARLKRSS